MDKVYVVFGYMNTGSGSLTYPEDFETVGFYEKEEDARAHVKRLNDEEGVPSCCRDHWEVEDSDEDEEEEDEDYDGMVYTVDVLENLKTKKRR